jgi:hypothetical protein
VEPTLLEWPDCGCFGGFGDGFTWPSIGLGCFGGFAGVV